MGVWSGLLQVAFIVLKLIGQINWSWPIVLLPLEIGMGLVLLYLAIKVAIIVKTGEDII